MLFLKDHSTKLDNSGLLGFYNPNQHRPQCQNEDKEFRMTLAYVGDMVTPTVNKGKPDLTKKVMPVVIARKPWQRKGVVNMCFEETVVVIVSPKGEMEGSAITSPIGKECADL
ncbi:hypothetical protein RDI58_024654 [Solanum bulbocastanum]|uniref:Uncharacterized protein n=1 Tax=Solanum bulbocastanum TaxID=147425 RepID=A0AAN8T6B3_SOLBU